MSNDNDSRLSYEELLNEDDVYVKSTKKTAQTIFSESIEEYRAKSDETPEYIERIQKSLIDPYVTDIHITEEHPLVIRMDGDICILKNVIVPKEGVTEITDKIFHLPMYERPNCAGQFGGYRVRLRSAQSRQCKQLFIRVLPGRAPDIYKMGYGSFLSKELLEAERTPGIVIVAGATGSGKSTLLAGINQYYLDNENIHLISAEDPIEYLLYSGKGEISQREIPDDVESFSAAIINALREDPDIILIGETRDQPTAEALLQASETGHLAFTTIHAPNIPGIIGRLKGLLVGTVDVDMRLAQVIRGCIYLTLMQDENGEWYRKAEVLWFDDKAKDCVRNDDYHKLQAYVQTFKISSNKKIKENTSNSVQSPKFL